MSTKFTGTARAYGLSAYGPILWFFGLPVGLVSNELEIKLTFVENNSNNTLFSKTYTVPKYEIKGNIYKMPNDFNYPSMLKDLYKNFTEDLKMNLQINTQNTKASGIDIISIETKLKELDKMKEEGLVNDLDYLKLKAKIIDKY